MRRCLRAGRGWLGAVSLAVAGAVASVALAGGGDLDPTTAALAEEAATIPGVAPGPAPAPEAIDGLTNVITSGLRCPVCQGLSVADSTSAAAVTMQRRTRALVEAGYRREDIERYYVQRYTEWILLSPTNEGLNKVVWLGPLGAGAVGLLVAASFLRSGARRADRSPLAATEGGPSSPSPTADPPPAAAPVDRWQAAVLAEVDDD
jgi:cytochrome c-type biogenesis protein CcmH